MMTNNRRKHSCTANDEDLADGPPNVERPPVSGPSQANHSLRLSPEPHPLKPTLRDPWSLTKRLKLSSFTPITVKDILVNISPTLSL